jgi:hypothetical protein
VKLGRRPGAFVAFLDSFTEESVLRVECDLNGVELISYRLYDGAGDLVADSEGPQPLPLGLDIHTSLGELLLHVPTEQGENITYQLYNSRGSLITRSDGVRTEIFGGLRIVGNKHLSGRPPGAFKKPEVEA